LKELTENNTTIPLSINKINEVLSEAVLNKARDYIYKYETETDAILFHEGLLAIKQMCQQVANLNLSSTKFNDSYITSYESVHIKKALQRRIVDVNKIVLQARGRRPRPTLSDDDKKVISDIERKLENIFGATKDLSLTDIVSFLLEVK
jgi:hypothetical protein